jgi:hypothetical protein
MFTSFLGIFKHHGDDMSAQFEALKAKMALYNTAFTKVAVYAKALEAKVSDLEAQLSIPKTAPDVDPVEYDALAQNIDATAGTYADVIQNASAHDVSYPGNELSHPARS